MLSKRYESTEVDRSTWLHVPSGTHLSTSSDTHQLVKVVKGLISRTSKAEIPVPLIVNNQCTHTPYWMQLSSFVYGRQRVAVTRHQTICLILCERIGFNDISVISVTAHGCAGGLKKKLYMRSGSKCNRHFVGSLTCPSKHRHGTALLILLFRETAQFSRLL